VIWGAYKNYDFAINGDTATASEFYGHIEARGNVKGWVKSSDKAPLEEAFRK